MLQYLRQLVGVRYCGIFLPGNNIRPESKRNNNNNNNNFPVVVKNRDDIRWGIVMSYGQMKRFLALVGNHLEMVPR